jgi:hypothetical protein
MLYTIISFNFNYDASAGSAKPTAENCNQVYNSTTDTCECRITDMRNGSYYVEECASEQRIKIEQLKTKSALLPEFKNKVWTWNDTMYLAGDCFYNERYSGSGMPLSERICFSDNQFVSYRLSERVIPSSHLEEWEFK